MLSISNPFLREKETLMADPARNPQPVPQPEIEPARPNRPEIYPLKSPDISKTDQPEISPRPDTPEVEPDSSPEILPDIHTDAPGD